MKIRTGQNLLDRKKSQSLIISENTRREGVSNIRSEADADARRKTILSCPFQQYSRSCVKAKPVGIPSVPHKTQINHQSLDTSQILHKRSEIALSLSLDVNSSDNCTAGINFDIFFHSFLTNNSLNTFTY